MFIYIGKSKETASSSSIRDTLEYVLIFLS